MRKETRNSKLKKSHQAKLGKRGYTLIELTIAMALLAVVAVAVVSFYQLMNGTLRDNRDTYEYLEDHDALQKTFEEWAAEKDVPGSVFKVGEDGKLTVTENGNSYKVSVSNGNLFLGGEYLSGFDEVSGISFETEGTGTLIKCITYHEHKDGSRMESCFVFSLRCGEIQGGVVGNE